MEISLFLSMVDRSTQLFGNGRCGMAIHQRCLNLFLWNIIRGLFVAHIFVDTGQKPLRETPYFSTSLYTALVMDHHDISQYSSHIVDFVFSIDMANGESTAEIWISSENTSRIKSTEWWTHLFISPFDHRKTQSEKISNWKHVCMPRYDAIAGLLNRLLGAFRYFTLLLSNFFQSEAHVVKMIRIDYRKENALKKKRNKVVFQKFRKYCIRWPNERNWKFIRPIICCSEFQRVVVLICLCVFHWYPR